MAAPDHMSLEARIQRALRVVWLNEQPGDDPHRYVPRAINGGPAWRVWDRKRRAWVKESKLARMTYEQVTELYIENPN